MRLRTNYSARVRAHRLLLLAATLISVAIVLGGCDQISGPQDGPAELTGSYTLADVGGNTLPAMIYEGPFPINGQRVNVRLDIRSSTMQLEANARYSIALTVDATAEGRTVPLSLTDHGEYSRNGNALEFRSQDGSGTFNGSVRGTDVSVLIDLAGDRHPPTYLFRK